MFAGGGLNSSVHPAQPWLAHPSTNVVTQQSSSQHTATRDPVPSQSMMQPGISPHSNAGPVAQPETAAGQQQHLSGAPVAKPHDHEPIDLTDD